VHPVAASAAVDFCQVRQSQKLVTNWFESRANQFVELTSEQRILSGRK